MVLPVAAHRVDEGSFEIESAFAEHLRLLRSRLGEAARELVIAGPAMAEQERAQAGSLALINEQEEGIYFRPMFGNGADTPTYWRSLPSTLRRLKAEVARADVVHGGLSPLLRPFEIVGLTMGRWLGKKTISVTDIDHRHSAKMNYQTGRWSRRQYLTTRLVHDVWMHAQQQFAARAFDLVLLKGKRLVEDYGAARDNVKFILDAAHGHEHIIAPDRLLRKQEQCKSSGPLRLCYFGRLVEYKGLRDMLNAIAAAKRQGALLHFDVFGAGPQEPELYALVDDLGLKAEVTFHGAVSFGPQLFEHLYDSHVLLAAPLREDTPRSALDGCAAGLVLLAYDTYYYKELDQLGAPVQLVPWRNVDAMAQRLVALSRDREWVIRGSERARSFADQNTQEWWLEQRVSWTQALFEPASVNA